MMLTVILFGVFLLCHQGLSAVEDSIPGLSQVKSLYQFVAGNSDGAWRTQENFLNTGVVASQIKSAVQAAQGDLGAARETQDKFAKNVKELAEVIGMAIGG
ncbi:hypothetical protein GE061_017957 [Apolygus lucorum]|uniref:Uncharacterized protein n=1 Tax=Apolygus lucorum TaxID=248454 RepID=A0A8S9XEJ3_APOLU|nr:hypothetical protein GE061_017957 [Apolygus lucorum]